MNAHAHKMSAQINSEATMSDSHGNSETFLFTSESVGEGHAGMLLVDLPGSNP